MLKNISKLEHKIGDRIYQFICDADGPLGEIHDALTIFKSYVVAVINSREPVKEDPKPE